jgi:hypothetical protein
MGSVQIRTAAPMREWKWSPAEKVVARRAFNLALNHELENAIREAKERAERIREAQDLWEMESWLAERRRRVDRTFDFRYSVLPLVFAALLRDRRLSEDDLRGLAQDKLDAIRHIAAPEQPTESGNHGTGVRPPVTGIHEVSAAKI